jgi:SNF2 family DNA or RNA helicase
MNESNLHKYQKTSVSHIFKNANCGLFLDMGLGKTVSTLTAIKKLIYEELEIDAVLVIAPKRVVESVWSAEVDKWDHLKGLQLSKVIGNEKQRKEAIRQRADIYLLSRDNVAWFSSTYQGIKIIGSNVMLVIDESSSFKNPKSLRFKALKMIQPCFARVAILTGTPAPNGLIDLWSQIYLLDRGERLGKTITSFRDIYFNKGKTNGHIVFNYIPKPEGDDAIHEKIKDICISMKAEDYLDMPAAVYNDIIIDLEPTTLKKYKDFERDKVLELLEAEEITAMNAAGLSNKLLQFAGGAVYDEYENWHEVHSQKLDAAEEVIEAANGKPVLIAYTYKHELERLLVRLKTYKPVKLTTDQDIIDWNAGKISILLMHPASGGHGLNLQEGGHLALWYSCNWSLELYQQFNARLARQGQKSIVTINRLIAKGTEDESVIKALDGKASTQEALMQGVKAKMEQYSRMLNKC